MNNMLPIKPGLATAPPSDQSCPEAPRRGEQSIEKTLGAALWVLWGSELSPFALKVEALLRHAGVGFRWLPANGAFSEALRFERRRRRLVSGRLPLTWPQLTELDEF